MPPYVPRLRRLIGRATPLLLGLAPDATAKRPAPGKWSPREILGHLIDSASNNHRRFVEGQLRDDLTFVGYEQDAWIRVQPYQESPWPELVELWQAFNLHLLRIMESVPEPTRERPRASHNLSEIGWDVPRHQPATLDFVMSDYVGHLEHHLRQILGEALDQPVGATREAPAERAVPILPADDIRIAKEFYVSKLGFRVTFEVTDGGSEGLLGLARGQIALTVDCPMDGHGRNACVALEVDDADAYYSEWSGRVDVLRPPKNEEWGARTFDLLDPFGNTIFVMGPVEP
jgi:catechol 2,3-dioxygenase-like lactoylglutathione lyase family enzyme